MELYGLWTAEDATAWLRQALPALGGLMTGVSALGRFEFYLAVLPLIYWCVDKRLGRDLAYLLAFSDLLNRVAKHLLHGPRPFWIDASLALGASAREPGYGNPSSHVQTAAVFYLALAARARRFWTWVLAGVAVLLMALSRVYVGSHFVLDALVGLGMALAVLAGYAWLRWRPQPVRRRAAWALPVLLVAFYAAALLARSGGASTGDPAWTAFYTVAERTSFDDTATAVGLLLGLAVGFRREEDGVGFSAAGSARQKAARYLVGIIVTVVLWKGLGALFAPVDPLAPALVLRALRYAVLGLWMAWGAPLWFTRIGLMSREPGVAGAL